MPFAPRRSARRLERWLWTGPVGHLVGGGLDLLGAYARYLLGRARILIHARGRDSERSPRR